MVENVLILGGAGFIGSHTVDRLVAEGHHVRILDALVPPVHIDGQSPAHLNPAAEFVRGDVGDAAILDAVLEGVDVVFHLAAYQDYRPDLSRFFDVNVRSTALLYERIVANRSPLRKVIVASSQFVHFGAFAPEEVDRQVVAFRFDENNVTQDVARYTLQDGQVVSLDRRVTDDGIQDVTFIGQLLE